MIVPFKLVDQRRALTERFPNRLKIKEIVVDGLFMLSLRIN